MNTAIERYEAYLELDRLFAGLPPATHWIDGGDAFWFVAPNAGKPFLHMVDVGGNQRQVALDTLTELFAGAFSSPDTQPSPFDRVSAKGDAAFRVHLGAAFVDVDPDGGLGDVQQGLDDPAPAPRVFNRQLFLAPLVPVPEVASHDRSRFASIQQGNVSVRACESDSATALTADVDPDIAWDLESGSISYGARAAATIHPWSPDDRYLFAVCYDRRLCHHIPTIDFTGPDVVVGRFVAERRGAALPSVTCAIFDIAGGSRIGIDVGARGDAFVCPLGWLADGSEFWLATLSRDVHCIEVLAVDPATGRCRSVLSERARSFVRIQHEVLYARNCGLTLLPDSRRFLWQSERDGWNHLFLYDRAGKLLRQLTSGDISVMDVKAFDQKGATVFFTARGAPGRPYDTHLYSVALEGGHQQRLTTGDGEHLVSISPTASCFTDWSSTVARPPTLRLHMPRVGQATELYRVDLDALDSIGWRAPEEFVVVAGDGETELWGVMYLPADFDPNNRYAVVENIYAGPQVVFAPHAFGLGSTFRLANQAQALAQLGFVVVVLDGRGTPGRSKAFHDAGHHRFGQFEIAEHASAIRQLAASRPWMDLDRVGIFGHSWGGHFALRALAEAGDLYKTAVASGSDLTGNNFLVEPYLGSPQDQPEANAAFSTLPLARQITGKLLLVAGTDEYPMLHDAMRMTQALIEAGVQHDLIILPGQSHGYRGASATYVVEASTRFLQRHLGGPTKPPGTESAPPCM